MSTRSATPRANSTRCSTTRMLTPRWRASVISSAAGRQHHHRVDPGDAVHAFRHQEVVDHPDVLVRAVFDPAAVVEQLGHVLVGQVGPGVRWNPQPESHLSSFFLGPGLAPISRAVSRSGSSHCSHEKRAEGPAMLKAPLIIPSPSWMPTATAVTPSVNSSMFTA